ncbi:O-antigen ligase family protein [Mordavella massiliensis]|uniref:O-antigen ligase family protein n=1 Tax=Mordavella massiliensis TaxID=1871024 RepID=UPI00210A9BFA|nr:O-antigen ligase family protein [Mordavella massiliensis]
MKKGGNIELQENERKILCIFWGVVLFLFGGYYGFAGCLIGIFLCVFLIYKMKEEGEFSIKINIGSVAFASLPLWYGIAVFYSVDKGMAFLGFLKIAVVPIFIILMQQYQEEREKLLNVVPIIGAGAVLLGIVVGITGVGKELFFLSGRFGGPFQYPNTMAVYLLSGMVLWEGQRKEKKFKQWLILFLILFIGILMTGSRSVFLMTVCWMLILAWKKQETRKYCFLILGGIITCAGIYTLLTADFQNIGRFFTFSFHSSTLTGRFLYWTDAILMILDYPFGTGYGGYETLQGLYQSGVYHVQYVHNDFLQYTLDIGILPSIFLVVAIVKSILNRRLCNDKKVVLFLMTVHSAFDFDQQFLAIIFLMLLCMDIDSGKEYIFKSRVLKWFLCIGMVGIYFYFGIAQLACYVGKYEMAYKMFPVYTEAAENLLKESNSIEQAENIAGKLLETAPYSEVSHSTLALTALSDHDLSAMQEEQEAAIRLAPYEPKGYEQYVRILASELSYCAENQMLDQYEKCEEALLKIPAMIEKTEKSTSLLGKKIRDIPKVELSDEIQEYLDMFLKK